MCIRDRVGTQAVLAGQQPMVLDAARRDRPVLQQLPVLRVSAPDGVDGFRVHRVEPGSPGHAAGLTSILDYIVVANGVRLETDDGAFVRMIQECKGQDMRLCVFNTHTLRTRETILRPNDDWGGSVEETEKREAEEREAQIIKERSRYTVSQELLDGVAQANATSSSFYGSQIVRGENNRWILQKMDKPEAKKKKKKEAAVDPSLLIGEDKVPTAGYTYV